MITAWGDIWSLRIYVTKAIKPLCISQAATRSLLVRERIEGYKKALAENGIAFDPNLIMRCDLKLEGGYLCALNALEHLNPKPTAIFAYSDLLATGVLKALRGKGIRVPEDIAIAGYDNIDFSPFLEPPLTTVDQFAYKIGKEGMDILLEKINFDPEETWRNRELIIKPELIVRQSSM